MGFLKKLSPKKAWNPPGSGSKDKQPWYSGDRGGIGLPSGIGALEDYFGISGADAEKRAAKAKEQLARQGIDEQERQFLTTYNQQKPFYEAGAAMLDPLAQASTAEGYGNALQQLLDNSQVSGIRNERIAQEGAGLGRDLSSLGNLDITEAMAIEDMLNQRKQSLAGRGLSAGTTTAGYGQGKANAISNLLGGIGQAQAQGAIGAQAARTQGMQQGVNLLGSLSNYFGNRPPSSSGSSSPGYLNNFNMYNPQSGYNYSTQDTSGYNDYTGAA